MFRGTTSQILLKITFTIILTNIKNIAKNQFASDFGKKCNST